jgi:pre-mRNA 3'-end-processing factor FIP1
VISKPAAKKETPTKGATQVSGADLPGISTSKIDVNAKPMYEPAGKPITQVNIDEGMLLSEIFTSILISPRST